MSTKYFLYIILILALLPISAVAGFEVVGKMVYNYSTKIGEIYSAVIKIRNTGDKDQELNIYLRDYLFNDQGASFFNEPGSNNRSNALWIKYSPQNVILKAKEIQNIQFEISVPKVDTLVGTYWSVIMIEGEAPMNSNTKGQFIVNESVRYAIQIITNIGKSGIGHLEFHKPSLIKEGEKSFFDFVILNTGEKYIAPDVSLELFDAMTGLSIKVLKSSKKGLYPTTSSRWRFPLEGLPKQKTYKAVIVADGSGEDIFGLEYTIVM